MQTPPIFDGHNDVLLRLVSRPRSVAVRDFLHSDGRGQIDLPRARAGNMVGGLFAIFPPPVPDAVDDDSTLNPAPTPGLSHASALRAMDNMLDLRDAIVADSQGEVALCCSAADVRAALARGALALVTHVEGAEVVSPTLDNLGQLHERGVRSLGLVWSRPNAFGHGVPFRFPSSPDTGDGLTDAGCALVKACNSLRMMVDVSHLNEKGFWDVARLSDAPLVASHSNAHAVAASSRNLTDAQLRAIGDSGGLAGLNFATGYLRADGHWTTQTPPEVMIRHLEHMLRLAGENAVALGSDFDGARVPAFIGDCAGLPRLVEAMQAAGFGSELIDKICWRNWLRVLEASWGA